MSFKIIPRLSEERGHANHGWLKTFHTFSFASYQADEHTKFGALRVLNEDRVDAHTGFGTHGHREFEIFSYVVSGELEHGDSMGNKEVLRRGDLQMTSAGTGIRHSEKAHGKEQVHFLQIWALPSKSNLTPQYFTRHFTDEEKKDKWAKVVAPVGTEDVVEKREASGPAPVHSPVTMFASLISPSTTLSHTFQPPSGILPRKAYIHVVQTSGYNPARSSGAHITISGPDGKPVDLWEGDGAYITGEAGQTLKVQNSGDKIAEVILFDLE